MELNLVCPHCRAEIPFKKPFVFTYCPECEEKLTITKQEVEKQGVIKSNLQKTNTSISNIMSAIEKGILTDTTKQRLEELENQKKDLQERR